MGASVHWLSEIVGMFEPKALNIPVLGVEVPRDHVPAPVVVAVHDAVVRSNPSWNAYTGRPVGHTVAAPLDNTVKSAAVLATFPLAFVATARYQLPESASGVPEIDSVDVKTPLYGTPFVRLVHVAPPLVETCHCSVGPGVPAAVTENDELKNVFTERLRGCVENDGPGLMVTDAVLELTEPTAFDTRTQ